MAVARLPNATSHCEEPNICWSICALKESIIDGEPLAKEFDLEGGMYPCQHGLQTCNIDKSALPSARRQHRRHFAPCPLVRPSFSTFTRGFRVGCFAASQAVKVTILSKPNKTLRLSVRKQYTLLYRRAPLDLSAVPTTKTMADLGVVYRVLRSVRHSRAVLYTERSKSMDLLEGFYFTHPSLVRSVASSRT